MKLVMKYASNVNSDYHQMSTEDIERELKEMRVNLYELNQKLNQKLNKYEMTDVSSFKTAQNINNSP